jgi:hydroxymethylpyrimidine kinase/phosphomethylpyrimidine kinase/thiamine-phosphate diphosphorylase
MINSLSCVLNISANDPLGLAGNHADMRAFSAMHVHGATVITATTAQNQHDFFELNPVSDLAFSSQLMALKKQDVFNVVKIGLIATGQQARTLLDSNILAQKLCVLDPVLAATSGDMSLTEERIEGIKLLLPFVDVLTPNLDEVQALLGITINSEASLEDAAKAFINLGVKAVLIKGGHSQHVAQDYFYSKDISFFLCHQAFSHEFSRGTGCVMASLIAACIARFASVPDAVVMAKMQIEAGFKHRFKIDTDSGGLGLQPWADHLNFDVSTALPVQLPLLYGNKTERTLSFKSCEGPLGLYPVVDRAHWLASLLPLGIKIIQLRIKDLQGDDLKNEIRAAIKIARQFQAKLFINDYWQLAIECEAYGVHLGQEDLELADLQAISQAGIRLGLSSHCFYEVARAKTIKPSYIAFGPVYKTHSKDMPWIPQGPNGLKYWRAHLPNIPMVAIGGIHGERFVNVKKTGVDAIAMISAITQAPNPTQAALDYKSLFDHNIRFN